MGGLGDQVIAEVMTTVGSIKTVVTVVLIKGANIQEWNPRPSQKLCLFPIVTLLIGIIMIVGLTFDR